MKPLQPRRIIITGATGFVGQALVGRGRKVFTCYKFATMKQGARQESTNALSS